MTQEQFAEQIGWSVATVRKWERATESRPVRGQRAADLDSWLAKLSPEQMRRFALAVSSTRPSTQVNPSPGNIDDEADVNRREFGKAAALTAVAFPASNHSRIGMADVERLNAFTTELETADQAVGGAGLLSAAVDALERSQSLLHSRVFDDATGRAWMSAVGALAVETGWLAYDADRVQLARRCYSDALSLASMAEDDELAVHACMNAALQSISLVRTGHSSPSYALALTRRAADLVRRRPAGRIHALIAAREAAAYGTAGDRRSMERAMSAAWREMDNAAEHEPMGECAPWLRFVDHSEIRFHEARACTDIGNHSRALVLHEVVAGEPASAGNSVHASAWWSAALARTGDTRSAVEAGTPVLEALEGWLASPRALKALEPVRELVDSASGGEEFKARFYALATAKGFSVD